MAQPSTSTVLAAIHGGLSNVAVILALYASAAYPTLDSATGTAPVALTGFTLGFVGVLVTAHTRLLSPAIGYLGVLGGRTYLELSTPMNDGGELNGHVVADGADTAYHPADVPSVGRFERNHAGFSSPDLLVERFYHILGNER